MTYDNEKTFIKVKFLKRFGKFKDFREIETIGIIKETQKAILVCDNIGLEKIWIPKSCFQLLKII